MDAKKGDWVRIHNIVLNPEDRSPNLPEDTKKVPLEMWDKGFLLNEGANIGDMVEVESYIGRKVEGKLVEVNPFYDHDFGKCVPELLYIGRQLRGYLEGSEQGE
ncbi:2-amino-4-ketopentanoate thiolase [Anaerosalibacter bizertensis]|uniref:2-amino-4-ketopentanoate thiolase n=1 Tax=Anaerosalibacter bizertensis TaxID=932217 RepID=A0A844FIE6_9FIRM|nr:MULTISPECIES: 2-amino-4-oxopentanoate thiolase subunit OrtA [Bacillota]MBV1821027.1 2-amino-4-ketopentanoate thiolase [Bacteroidales bacterium MSK.15.36]HHV26868.1 2-amino-4-ketopentanoate thiolase [Tissierellia bacterium]MBU5292738.1 2-amino-4-ketopentanoate thiolase [Anaerosalibacter bizertensis]MCB5559624.1 2-amino-4-ketopentanoate thiolase [Anaerosalibacter bizertensis]MCG4566089.1 2-amino-4-ketopentanoate thiolase [Anaerosalibacter bizertensis]